MRVHSYWWFALKLIFLCVSLIYCFPTWSFIVMQQPRHQWGIHIYIFAVFGNSIERTKKKKSTTRFPWSSANGSNCILSCPLFNYNQLKCILSITFMGSQQIMCFFFRLSKISFHCGKHALLQHARIHSINNEQLRRATNMEANSIPQHAWWRQRKKK